MMTKTKTKTNIGVGLVMSVVLVVGGAIFGSMALNAVSALSFSNDNQWQYVYGPDKNRIGNFNKLYQLIKLGADVKVFVDGQIYKNCDEIVTGELGDDIMIVCNTGISISSPYGHPPSLGGAIQYKNDTYRINKIDLNNTVIFTFISSLYDGGKIEAYDEETKVGLIKWYAKR